MPDPFHLSPGLTEQELAPETSMLLVPWLLWFQRACPSTTLDEKLMCLDLLFVQLQLSPS